MRLGLFDPRGDVAAGIADEEHRELVRSLSTVPLDDHNPELKLNIMFQGLVKSAKTLEKSDPVLFSS